MKVHEIITLVIAALGLVLSLLSWAYTLITQRRKIAISISEIKSYSDVTYLRMAFENQSRLPIAITRIALFLGEKIINCTVNPTLVTENTHRDGKGQITRVEVEKSTVIPIQIQSLGAVNALVLFEHLPELPEDDTTHLTFLIATNRGKAFETILELPKEWASQRKPF